MKKVLAFLILSAACFGQTVVTGAGSPVTHGNITSTAITNTGGTSEAWLADVVIPANLPLNALIKISAQFRAPSGNTGTCTVRLRYGTTAHSTGGIAITNGGAIAATNIARVDTEIKYRNSSSAQWVSGSYWSGSASVTGNQSGTAVSTTSVTYVALTVQNSVAADSCNLENGDYFIYQQ